MRLRLAAGASVALLGLLPYQLFVIAGVSVSIALGLWNVASIGRQAGQIKALQEGQGQRIDRLPPPPGG